MILSATGPCCIIPASVATLFALELQPVNSDQATVLVGTVFLVIRATVASEAGFARHITEALDVLIRVIIVSGGRVGRGLAGRLDRGENVVVDESPDAVERTLPAGFTAKHGDGTDIDVLETSAIENAKVVARRQPTTK